MGGREALDYWLAMSLLPGLGNIGIARAWRELGSGDAIWQASARELSVFGIRPAVAAARDRFSAWEKVACLRSRAAALSLTVLTLDDPLYPSALKEIVDPPPVLFLQGSAAVLQPPAIAIVGARRASELGRRFAFGLASELAAAGVCVVSGLALGVDGAAHEGALQSGGPTLAVLGTGIDQIYPSAHRHLRNRIQENGLLLSEFPPGSGPERHHFPRRNRVISGLSAGVVVVEAGGKSGSLITARLALEQGREVFAVPGPPGLPGSQGVNRLLKEGAQLVESADDIFAALPWLADSSREQRKRAMGAARGRPPVLSPDEAELVAVIGADEKSFDELAAMLAWDSRRLSRALLELELDGRLFKSGGGWRLDPGML